MHGLRLWCQGAALAFALYAIDAESATALVQLGGAYCSGFALHVELHIGRVQVPVRILRPVRQRAQGTGANQLVQRYVAPALVVPDFPITDKLSYIWDHLTDFLRARGLLDLLQKGFGEPTVDGEDWVTFYANALPEKAKRLYQQYGSHWHGTRLQSLGNILMCGLRDSNPAITEGSRTLGDRCSHIGVHFFQQRKWVMSRYCLWQDCVGDQVYWSVLIEAAVDWNLRITPTRRNQVVIPQPYVYIRSLRFNICRCEQLLDGCLILPIWVHMLEAAYRLLIQSV